MKPYLRLGDWNATCDVCGFKFKASQMKKRWDGLMVCESDWESRNPLDFLRVYPDHSAVPWSRPELGEGGYTDNITIEDKGTPLPGGTAPLTGDGGIEESSDTTISTPSITFPNSIDYSNISSLDTATSSAFSATGGRTHSASRWLVFYIGENDVDPWIQQPTLLYDSGVDSTNKTSLPFTDLEFEHLSWYKIAVRYKASDGNWSQWSEYQHFETADCIDIPDPYVNWDFSELSSLGIVAGRIGTVADLGTAGINLTADNTGTIFDPLYSTAQFADGAALIGGKEGFSLSGPLQDVAGKLTLIFVAYWVNNPGLDGALMLTQNSNTLVVGGYQAGFQQLIAIPGLGYGYCASVPVPPSLLSGQILTTGKHILIFTINSSGTSRVYLNGTQYSTSTNNFSALSLNYLCAQAGTMVARNYHLAEFIAYDVALDAEQVAYENARLTTKWGL